MAYQTYITEAIVLGSYNRNTADRSYVLLTKRAGMVFATARSVREERSRQRYALQDFSHVSVTLIKGKGGWRIGSVDTINNFFFQAPDRAVRGSLVKLAKLIRRYVHGEVPEPHLYTECHNAFCMLATPVPDRAAYEGLAHVRLLYRLGYVAPPRHVVTLLELPYPALPATAVVAALPLFETLHRDAQAVSHLPA